MDESQFDDLIQQYALAYKFPWLLIKGQIWAESGFDPAALSDHGASGLMQLMPATAREMGLDTHEIFDPSKNIEAGVKYDRIQYDHFPEISLTDERLHFMLASYNCGRGYVNQALKIARENEFGFRPLATIRGQWEFWTYSRPFLGDHRCEVGGKRPDFIQVWEYVEKIWRRFKYYESAGRIAQTA